MAEYERDQRTFNVIAKVWCAWVVAAISKKKARKTAKARAYEAIAERRQSMQCRYFSG